MCADLSCLDHCPNSFALAAENSSSVSSPWSFIAPKPKKQATRLKLSGHLESQRLKPTINQPAATDPLGPYRCASALSVWSCISDHTWHRASPLPAVVIPLLCDAFRSYRSHSALQYSSSAGRCISRRRSHSGWCECQQTSQLMRPFADWNCLKCKLDYLVRGQSDPSVDSFRHSQRCPSTKPFIRDQARVPSRAFPALRSWSGHDSA